MTRLLIHVEGPTEEKFVSEALAPHLYAVGYTDVSARMLGKQRQRGRRGGIRPWPEARQRIINCLREDPGQFASTMVDYYGLPQNGPAGWPGRAQARRLPFSDRVAHVENAIYSDIANEIGDGFNTSRFLPYVMMHEFEAMLFSDCGTFAQAISRPDLAVPFQGVRDRFDTPEEINDSPEAAPSKRILGLVPSYQKPLLGVAAASDIGLAVIRRECPHFGQWLTRLEDLIA